MKILIIYPYCIDKRIHEEDIRVVPIGVYYVAAVLRENQYDVEILNWHNIHKTPQVIVDTLVEKKPDVIGFSTLHANRWGAIDIAKVAKRINPKVKIVFGGIGATFLFEHLLTHFQEIDFTVIGEGEFTFLNLIRCIEKGDYEGIANIPGLAFRKDGKLLQTPKNEELPDLDALPVPSKYFTYQHVALTRGCPWACTFCGSPRLWENRVRFHSSTYFVDQIERLYKKGETFFFFSDDTFTLNKDLVIEICKEILNRNLKISWAAISRVNLVDEEILYWMRMAGCIQISYGVESGSAQIRNRLNKTIEPAQIKQAFRLTTQYGILARAYFIYGSPGESWDTIQETTALMRDIKPLSAIFYILDIFPGTELYLDFLKRTGFSDDIWLERIEDIMYFETDSRLSPELILAFGKKLRTEFHRHIEGFIDEIQLVDNKDLYRLHADFFSKLAMTFSHGDYAHIESIKNTTAIAEKLHKKSLGYFPNHRAYLGLGIILQKRGAVEASIDTLLKGIESFPESEPLHMCLGINHMNLSAYDKALSCFMKFQGSKEADEYIARCYEAMGK